MLVSNLLSRQKRQKGPALGSPALPKPSAKRRSKGLALNQAKGFSVMEILVVVFIIGLISVLVLVNFRTGRERNLLNTTVQRLSADLHRAQNLALSGSQQGLGYGVHVTTPGNSQYIIFYNTDSSLVYHATAPASVTIDTVTLSGITISAGSDVYFVPPDPTTNINGSPSGSRAFTLTTSGGQIRNVTVYASGRIEL